jgi:single-strand DNA-binding protein
LADIAAQYVKKGDKVLVVGAMEYRKWTDKEGVERTAAEVRVSDLRLLGGKKGDEAAPKAPRAVEHVLASVEDDDSDLPF